MDRISPNSVNVYIFISVDPDELIRIYTVQNCLENAMRVPTMWNVRLAKTPFKLRNSKWCSVSSLTLMEY